MTNFRGRTTRSTCGKRSTCRPSGICTDTRARQMPQVFRDRWVSIGRQGVSGLRIKARRDTVPRFPSAGTVAPLGELTEIETGKDADTRPSSPACCRAGASSEGRGGGRRGGRGGDVGSPVTRRGFFSDLMVQRLQFVVAERVPAVWAIAAALNARGIRTARVALGMTTRCGTCWRGRWLDEEGAAIKRRCRGETLTGVAPCYTSEPAAAGARG